MFCCTSDYLFATSQDEHKDVMVVLQAHDSAMCQEFYKYVKVSKMTG